MSLFSARHPSINNPEQTEKTVCETVCLYPYPDKKSLRRTGVVFVLLLAASAFFIVRLWELAMYDNTAKTVLSGQYTRSASAAGHTGFVYDKAGALLSHAEAGAVALVNPCGRCDKDAAAEFLLHNSRLTPDEILAKINGTVPFSVTLSTYPGEHAPSGVYVYPRYEENTGTLCRHLLGYRGSDGSGKDGIYRRYDSFLSSVGTLSYRYMADAKGQQMTSEVFSVINNGYTDKSGVVLTVDKHLQELLDAVCDDYIDMGAAVLCDLSDNSVAALASRPLYAADDVASVLDSARGELINRAFSLYTPGSVFKTVVAAAALEEDPSLYDFTCECTGSVTVSGKVFHCHKHSGHGVQNMKEGFANSCNVYFLALAEKTGLDAICAMAQKLGLGEAHSLGGLYIPAAKLPDTANARIPAYVANACIGQGDVMVSPVDLASVYAACVTGFRRNLTLVKGLWEESDSTSLSEGSAPEGKLLRFCDTIPVKVLSDATVRRLRDMMCACVRIGTGWQASAAPLSVGGKTATAQTGQYKDGKEVLNRFFAGFFPADEPQYVLVILCEGNGDNHAVPAKIFAEFVEMVAAAGEK